MKTITTSFLLVFLSFSLSAQLTFDWVAQPISEGNNLQRMNIVNDTTTILIGYGRTFVKSADKGLTWDNVPIFNPLFDFDDLSINSSGLGFACAGDEKVIDNPSSSSEDDVYAEGILLNTTDFGATWTLIDPTTIGTGDNPALNPSADGCYARDFISVEVLEDNTILLGMEWYFHNSVTKDRESFAAVMMSKDGTTWEAITDDGKYPLGIVSATNSVYFGGNSNLYRYDIADGSVTDIYTALTTAASDLTVFIWDFAIVSDDEVYVVTSTNAIFLTTDQGVTFTELGSGAPAGGNDMIVVNDTVMMVLGTSAKSKVTRDGGTTWEDCYPGSTCYEIGGILNDSIIGLGKSDIYKIAVADVLAGNYTWVSQTLSDGNNLQKMYIQDANNAIIVGYGSTLVSTSDAGLTWNAMDTPELFVYGAGYDFSSVSTMGEASYSCARRLTTVDLPSSSDYSDVYGHGLIYRSLDYWKTWELLDQANIGTGDDPVFNPNVDGCYGLSPTEIACINDTIAYVYVTWLDTIAGIDSKLTHSNVFKTEDGGDSWLPLFEDFGSSYVNSIDFLDKDNGFIVGNTIFRKTSDGGETFDDLYPALQTTGSPDDSTLFLYEIDYIDENKWYLPTSVDGIFVTEDGGTNYSELPLIGGGSAMMVLDDNTLVVLGTSAKSKISWDSGNTWTDIYPGSSIWEIGGILNDSLVALAKTNLYKIAVADLAAPSSEAMILTFALAEQTGDAVIDAGAGTIAIEVEKGTDVTKLTPTITISDGATVTPASEVEQDFTNPVTYTVTAEDLTTTKDWVVTVSVAVGLEESPVNSVMIYPNPAKEKLFLENLEKVERISVLSITGSSVLSLETPADRAEISLDGFENGIYFIYFYKEEGSVLTKKFVKN